MELDELSLMISTIMNDRCVAVGGLDYGVSGLWLFRYQATTSFTPATYRPHVCMVIQGRKDLSFQDREVQLTPGTAIVVSQDLSAISRVSDATVDAPYLAAVMPIDMDRLRKVADRINDFPQTDARERSFITFQFDEAFSHLLKRIVVLTAQSREAQLLSETYRDEFHALLLLSEAGADLCKLLTENSRANRVARAIAHIRSNLERGSTIQELMEISGMSKSTLHETFRSVTGESPLQFQKNLRLLEARSLLTTDKEPVSQIAFAVGYSSATQFAREYKRAFGRTPMQDRRESVQVFV